MPAGLTIIERSPHHSVYPARGPVRRSLFALPLLVLLFASAVRSEQSSLPGCEAPATLRKTIKDRRRVIVRPDPRVCSNCNDLTGPVHIVCTDGKVKLEHPELRLSHGQKLEWMAHPELDWSITFLDSPCENKSFNRANTGFTIPFVDAPKRYEYTVQIHGQDCSESGVLIVMPPDHE